MTHPKHYFIDSGLLNLFIINSESALLENMIAIELIRRYTQDGVTYYQDGNIEVDFIVMKESIEIQSSYSLRDEATREREIRALTRFNNRYPMNENIILTYDEEETIEIDHKKMMS